MPCSVAPLPTCQGCTHWLIPSLENTVNSWPWGNRPTDLKEVSIVTGLLSHITRSPGRRKFQVCLLQPHPDANQGPRCSPCFGFSSTASPVCCNVPWAPEVAAVPGYHLGVYRCPGKERSVLINKESFSQ